jgi:2-keto-4-pentenoate hydratase
MAPLDATTAAEVAAHLYADGEAGDCRAWKLGALDEATQVRLGLAGPLVAPVLCDGLRLRVTEADLSRAQFVAPRLEAEIGVFLGPDGPQPVPCVEVADCRIHGWRPPPGWATADFGLQGAMIFGPPGPGAADIEVVVRRDGSEVGHGSASLGEVLARLELLPPAVHAPGLHVATGSVTPLYDAVPGKWEFQFSNLPTLLLNVS